MVQTTRGKIKGIKRRMHLQIVVEVIVEVDDSLNEKSGPLLLKFGVESSWCGKFPLAHAGA